MPGENIDSLQRANEAINRRDLDAFLALMDDEIEAGPRLVSLEGGYRGHEGIRRWWASLFDAFPDYEVEVVGALEAGDLTVAELRWRGHGAGSDTPFDETIWQVARWKSGKMVRWRVLDSRAAAIEEAGLSE